jgi:hypothetical protein
MNVNLSPTAWIALTCLVGAVLLSAVSLWNAWRQARRPSKSAPPPQDRLGPSFTRTWQKEEEQIAELAKRVKELKKE